MKQQAVWHWWHNGKRITRREALMPPGIYDMRVLDVRLDHKGRLLYDAEMLRHSSD